MGYSSISSYNYFLQKKHFFLYNSIYKNIKVSRREECIVKGKLCSSQFIFHQIEDFEGRILGKFG